MVKDFSCKCNIQQFIGLGHRTFPPTWLRYPLISSNETITQILDVIELLKQE